VALACAATLAAAGTGATPARADGDPASDVLATQALFLPWDAAVPAARQAQLASLLAAGARSGYDVRVALIASATDLGSVTALWGRPQEYSQFLGDELSLVYRGPLLVIMPDGFGVHGFDRSPASLRATLAGISPAGGGARLAGAALLAVERLAAAAGHPLSAPHANARSAPGEADTGQWLVLAAGAALIAAAWAASLRARPLRMRPLGPSAGSASHEGG
jgi:hypothetical protein